MAKEKQWTETHDGHVIRFTFSEHDNWPSDPPRRKWTRHDWGFAIIASIYAVVFLAALLFQYPF